MTWQLVKTVLLNRWEVSQVGKDGLISKHGPAVTPEQMEAITFDFLKTKYSELKTGFRVRTQDGYMLTFDLAEGIE